MTALVAVFLSWPVSAQQAKCWPAGEVVANLLEKYGEVPAAEGDLDELAGGRGVLFIDPVDQSWTMTIATMDGLMCPYISGTGWRAPTPITKTGYPA